MPLAGSQVAIDQKVLQVVQDVKSNSESKLLRSGAARLDSGRRIQLDIQTSGLPGGIARQLRALGAAVTEVVDEMHVAEAWVPADKLEQVAALPGVEAVRLPYYVFTNVTSAGDGIHNADDVRNQFAAMGIDGTGIKIGVISNGVNHKANVGTELPTVTVDPAHPGSGDEGTAMLEIVHDLAPGAELYFAGITTSTAMIPSITYLVSQGCDVIVDDLSFFGESFFSDSAIAQKVASVVANDDVVYVTSAGNYSDDQHYQAQYVQGLSATAGGRLHQLGSPGQDVNEVSIPNGSTFRSFLQWSDPWGGSSNNYDLYLYNSATFAQLDNSISVQDGQIGDLPFESLQWTNNTGATVQAQIWIERKNGEASRELELFTIGNSSMQFETDGDALIGQEAVTTAMSVAAANAASPSSVTSYSSRGGSTVYNFITMTKTTRQTLDGTAIDGVQTKIGQLGFFSNPFYGTSAAAPHAAAIAALVRQVKPSLTPAQVIQTMADTAVDLGAAGYDTTSGAGRYDALGAVYKAFTPSAPDMIDASDHGPSNTDNITNDTTPTFSGAVPAGSYVRLFVDGVQNQAVQLGAGVTSYNLTTSALSNGAHVVTIRVAANSSVSLSNNSNVSPGVHLGIDTVAPSVTDIDFNYDVAVQNLTWKFNDTVAASVQVSDLTLENTTNMSVLNSADLAASPLFVNEARFTFPGFVYGALPDGEYTATLAAASVTDTAGNPLAADSTFDFFFLNGDADHDGDVDVNDLGILAGNWQQSNCTFSQGDFTYDGQVNVSDLGELASRWQASVFASAPAQTGEATAHGDDYLMDLLA
jgi:hypothetical protein